MDKRAIAKYIVRTATAGIAADVINKTLIHYIPSTERFKIASTAGGVGGMIVTAKTLPHTDAAVDRYFDKLEARKNKN